MKETLEEEFKKKIANNLLEMYEKGFTEGAKWQQEQDNKEAKILGECSGNSGNGCFLDSSGHDCGCFTRVLKEEPKKETTLEEVAHKMLSDYGIMSMGQSIGVLEVKKLMVKMAKWQQERSYSEEKIEFIKTLIDFYWSNYNNEHPNNLKDFELTKRILETFKKK